MSKLKHQIVYYGNQTLKKVAEEVDSIDEETKKFTDEMFDLMYESNGIGLAAPQIDIPKRIIVYDTGKEKGALINPEIIQSSTKQSSYEEGCLSLPGISKEVIRPAEVIVHGFSSENKKVVIKAKGLLATVLQHEIDHLNGVLFIDHLEDYLQKELRSLLKKIKKLNKE